MACKHKCIEQDCKHEKVKYCEKCGKVYCEECGKEWGEGYYTYWYSYPNGLSVNDPCLIGNDLTYTAP